MELPTIELDEFGGTSLQAYLCALTLEGVQERLGPPHKTDIQGKVSKWWGFRCGPWRWSVYERIGDDELHIGGISADAAWFALTVLRVPQSIAWRPSGVPRKWWSALVNAEVPRRAHNAEVSGAGTASAGLSGYAGDNNGE